MMQAPLPKTTVRARYFVRGAVRLILVVLIAWGLLDLIRTFYYQAVNGFWGAAVHYLTDSSAAAKLYPLIIVSAIYLLVERRLFQWIFPWPKNQCPACGYSMRSLSGNRCPECGIEMTASQSRPE